MHTVSGRVGLRPVWLLCGLALMPLACRTGSGPPPLSATAPAAPPAGSAALVLQPGMSVAWRVTGPGTAASARGQGQVTPAGTLTLGPYGPVQVAGLTVAQAETAALHQLRHTYRIAKVQLQVLPATVETPVLVRPVVEWRSDGSVQNLAPATAPPAAVPQDK